MLPRIAQNDVAADSSDRIRFLMEYGHTSINVDSETGGGTVCGTWSASRIGRRGPGVLPRIA
jgi:hypothetical protein